MTNAECIRKSEQIHLQLKHDDEISVKYRLDIVGRRLILMQTGCGMV